MTTLTQAASSTSTGARGTSLGRLFHVELRKLTDTAAGKGLLGLAALLTVGASLLPLLFGNTQGLTLSDFARYEEHGWSIVIPFVGILAATSEWRQRTVLTTHVLEPRRIRVHLTKFLVCLVIGVAAVCFGLLTAAVVNQVAMATAGINGQWNLTASQIGAQLVLMLLRTAMAFGFGLAILNGPATVVAFLFLPQIPTIMTMVPALKPVQPWVDLSSAADALTSGGFPSGIEVAHIASCVGLWCLLPLAIGLFRVSKREIA